MVYAHLGAEHFAGVGACGGGAEPSGVQGLLGYRAFWGAEPSGGQSLVGCRALWGAEPSVVAVLVAQMVAKP